MSSSPPAILVEHLDKHYQLYVSPRARLQQFVLPPLRRLLARPPRNYYREHGALRDISFAVERGETVGIVGANGSGKSTLLQIIAGILRPSAGAVTVHGRVAALLELGCGFNAEFTGRENVFLNAAVLGLTRAQIAARFADIAAFADIGAAIEQPVKTYSTGMMLRLAFAVSVCVQPDIWIIDEALAVGDAAFQAKCMLALRQFQQRGGTVLLVSHDINAVRSLCRRALYLDGGTLCADGDAASVCATYLKKLQVCTSLHLAELVASEVAGAVAEPPPPAAVSRSADLPAPQRLREFAERTARCREGTGEARVLFAELVDEDGAMLQSAAFGQQARVRVLVEGVRSCALSVNYRLCNRHGVPVLGADFLMERQPLLQVGPGSLHWVEYAMHLPLLDGDYVLRISLTRPIDRHRQAVFAEIVEIAQVFSVREPEHAKPWTAVHLPNGISVCAVHPAQTSPCDSEEGAAAL